MNTSPFFDEIVATCTLVTMRAVIPSLLEYQFQIKRRIERFCVDLQKKHCDDGDLDALCRLTCLVVDLNTRQNLEEQGMSWNGYELQHVFYGVSSDPLFSKKHAVLLFEGEDEELAYYARRLFTLSPLPLAGSTKTQQLAQASFDMLTGPSQRPTMVNNEAENVADIPPPHHSFWTPLIKQLLAIFLLNAALWSACWYSLQETI